MISTAFNKNGILKIIKKSSRKHQEIQKLRARSSKILIVTENIIFKSTSQFKCAMTLCQYEC